MTAYPLLGAYKNIEEYSQSVPSSRNVLTRFLVQRPTTIKIKAQDMSGAKVNVTLTGWQARIFQHEFDHLQVCPSRARDMICHT